eukprot:4546800-Pleurochrysis_carterae.AAC.1
MPIEKENLAIFMNVTNASPESIAKYVRELNFTGPVSRAAERELRANVAMQSKQQEKITDDVDAVVEYLRQKLGASWSVASRPRAQTSSLLVNPPRSARPWVAIAKIVETDESEKWVKSRLDSKISWM